MVEEQLAKLAKKIKKRRKQLGLSLREAANVTHTSPSTIQKIESNEMVPTIAVLMKIAQGFNQSVGYFLDGDSEPTEVGLVRKDQRKTTNLPASHLRVEYLGSNILDAQLEAALLSIEKGGKSGKDPLVHAGEEIKFCVEGEISYFIDGEEYTLGPGDCIHFKSDKPHYWKNQHEGTTRILSVVFSPLQVAKPGKADTNKH